VIELSEKICERCNQPIRKGEGYAETDIGTGKWVHWPSCPPSARVIPEATASARKKWAIEKYYVFKTSQKERPYQLQYQIEGQWDLKDFPTHGHMRYFMNLGEAQLPVHATRGTETVTWQPVDVPEPKLEEGTVWTQFEGKYSYTLIQPMFCSEGLGLFDKTPQWVWRVTQWDSEKRDSKEIDVTEKKLLEGHYSFPAPGVELTPEGTRIPHQSNPENPHTPGEIQLVDGLTLKDYYDLRDLRLFLWGLEKELVGKYGIIEAEPLSSKVRELIKKKIEQVTSKIGSSPEHHSSPTELPSIIYGGEGFWRNTPLKDMWLPSEAVKAFFDYWFYPQTHLPQYFSQELWKSKVEEVGGSVHLPAEHLGPIEKQGKYSKIYVYRTDNIYFVPVYFEHDGERYVKFVHLKVGASEPLTHHSSGNPDHVEPSSEHHVSREEAEAEINVLIDNLAEAIKKGGEIPDYLRQALRKGFMWFKSNPGFPPQYTDFEQWLKKAQDMTMEQFKALPQERKDFIYGLFKSQWGNPHPSVSSGDSILRPPF